MESTDKSLHLPKHRVNKWRKFTIFNWRKFAINKDGCQCYNKYALAKGFGVPKQKTSMLGL